MNLAKINIKTRYMYMEFYDHKTIILDIKNPFLVSFHLENLGIHISFLQLSFFLSSFLLISNFVSL